MESNWTEPWLFALYSIVKPVAGAFILVLMYLAFTVIQPTPPGMEAASQARFNFVYVGNTFFIFVAATLFGTFQVIQADREWYQTIRYIYISPMSFYTYIVGRAASKVAIATFAAVITLAFGVAFLNVRVGLALADVPLFVAAMLLGLLCLVAIGICLAALSFLTAKHVHGLAEGIPGLFYLFCGVLFPISVLPSWGQDFGRWLPLTYWFDLERRLVLPPETWTYVQTNLPTENGWTLAVLLVSTLLFYVASLLLFRVGEYLARRAGKIDMTTAY
jgi:ABC-2 type transport system permease protein